jgi:hypothetical protein
LSFKGVRFSPEKFEMRYAKGTLSISASRDIPLLVQIRNSRFITHQQLFEFAQLAALESSRRCFGWRVQRLLASRNISVCEGIFGRETAVYCIARQGLRALENHCKFATVLNSATQHLPHPSHADHALELNSIQLALAHGNVLISWQSDVETASANTVSTRPLEKDYDAIVDVWNSHTMARFALEYERTLKSAQQYGKICRALEAETAVGCVLYLTSGEEISMHLAHELSGISKRLAFATAAAFRKNLLDTMVLTHPSDPEVSFRTQLRGVI